MKFFEEGMPEFNFPNHMSKEILLLENRRDVPKKYTINHLSLPYIGL